MHKGYRKEIYNLFFPHVIHQSHKTVNKSNTYIYNRVNVQKILTLYPIKLLFCCTS